MKTRKELLDDLETLLKMSDRILQDAREIMERSDAIKKKLAMLEVTAKKGAGPFKLTTD